MLDLQHLDLPNLMGRSESQRKGEKGRDFQGAESGEEFDFRTTEEIGMSGSAGELLSEQAQLDPDRLNKLEPDRYPETIGWIGEPNSSENRKPSSSLDY